MSNSYYLDLPRQNEYGLANKNVIGMYFIGMESGNTIGTWRNGHRDDTLIINMAHNIDNLSPDLWLYLGRFKTTKRAIRDMAKEIVERVNEKHGTNFVRAVVE